MFKSYNFWVRLVAVLVLLARIVLNEFGIEIDSGLIIDIATAVASILVVLGVIQVPSSGSENQNNGGSEMKTIEQIKEDIKRAKEEIVTKFTDTVDVDEITAIFNSILGEDNLVSEKIEEIKEVVIGTEEVPVDTREEIGEENVLVQEQIGENMVAEEVKTEKKEETEELEDASLTNAQEEKLKEVLKTKIREVLERDMEEIINLANIF